MLSNRLRAAVLLSPLLASLPFVAACGSRYRHSERPASQLAFGVEMAQRGLWTEALFRFHQAERLEPNNARVQNNLGVAYEAAGQYDQALDHYKSALKLDPNNKELRANYSRFVEFYQGFKPGDKAAGTTVPTPANRPSPPTSTPPRAPIGIPEPKAPGGPGVPSQPPPMDVPPPPPPL